MKASSCARISPVPTRLTFCRPSAMQRYCTSWLVVLHVPLLTWISTLPSFGASLTIPLPHRNLPFEDQHEFGRHPRRGLDRPDQPIALPDPRPDLQLHLHHLAEEPVALRFGQLSPSEALAQVFELPVQQRPLLLGRLRRQAHPDQRRPCRRRAASLGIAPHQFGPRWLRPAGRGRAHLRDQPPRRGMQIPVCPLNDAERNRPDHHQPEQAENRPRRRQPCPPASLTPYDARFADLSATLRTDFTTEPGQVVPASAAVRRMALPRRPEPPLEEQHPQQEQEAAGYKQVRRDRHLQGLRMHNRSGLAIRQGNRLRVVRQLQSDAAATNPAGCHARAVGGRAREMVGCRGPAPLQGHGR